MTTTFNYFAYGSNMSQSRLKRRTPSATAVSSGQLLGYRLVFDKVSKDGSGKADCEKSLRHEDVVHGGIFSIEDAELDALDKAEGRGNGYERITIKVKTASGDVIEALTYVATKKDSKLRPYTWYVEHVLRGAREFGLTDEYVAGILAVDATKDPDAERERVELAIYDQH